MAVTLSDDEGFDHDLDSDQEGKFMAFIDTTIVDDFVKEKCESPSNKELFENADLHKAYNKLCKIVAN